MRDYGETIYFSMILFSTSPLCGTASEWVPDASVSIIQARYRKPVPVAW
jgi:hypothetical protein